MKQLKCYEVDFTLFASRRFRTYESFIFCYQNESASFRGNTDILMSNAIYSNT